jgi:hypothetical protein
VTWRSLSRIGFQIVLDKEGREVPGELRNCTCGSTLTLPVPLDEVLDVARGTPDRLHGSAARTAIEALLVENADLKRTR